MTTPKGKRKRQLREAREAQEKRRRAGAELAQVQGARQDVHAGYDPGGWGTGAAALGLVKAASEESKHVVCGECGSSGGRHMRGCPDAR